MTHEHSDELLDLLRAADAQAITPVSRRLHVEDIVACAERKKHRQRMAFALTTAIGTCLLISIFTMNVSLPRTNSDVGSRSTAKSPTDRAKEQAVVSLASERLLSEVRVLRAEVQRQHEVAIAVGQRLDQVLNFASGRTDANNLREKVAALELSRAEIARQRGDAADVVVGRYESVRARYPGTYGATRAAERLAQMSR